MNKIYRVLWNEALNAWVAVAEIAHACGKRSKSSASATTPCSLPFKGRAGEGMGENAVNLYPIPHLTSPLKGEGLGLPALRPLALALALIAVSPAPTFAQSVAQIAANALPTNGQIVGGAGSISQSGSKMTVNQTTDRMIANWQTFNIGKDATVQFIQPGAGSTALNRVLDSQNPSQILGKLQANGQVFLINPAGVFFGKGSQVDVAGLVATSQKLSDADFMARLNKFTPGGAGAIINEGKITLPPGGLVAFIAPVVKNSGEIHAPQGTVVLAAASEVDIDFGGDGLVTVRVKQSALDHLADNAGLIKADDGVVILTAGSAKQLLAGAVNNSGIIEAKGISKQGGRIVLDGGAVSNSGTLDASSRTQAGGTIEVSGKTVDLGGTVNVSGSTAGQITLDALDSLKVSGNLIAAGLAGRGGTISASAGSTLTQSASARVDASGSSTGSGGSITLQAAQDIMLEGSINATASDSTGGTISLVAAHNVTVHNAVLDASGASGGGRIHVQAGNSTTTRKPTDPPAPEEQRPTLALTGSTTLRVGSSRGRGGKVTLGGEQIGLLDTTLIDATGETGGGTVLVGGDWQGKATESFSYATAQAVVMGEKARIDVSAKNAGAGGTAVLWSEAYTGFYGNIAARGGATSGNGGQVETSSHNNLQAMGNVDASASAGQAGNWLLDPWNLTITSINTNNGSFNGGSPNTYTPAGTGATAINTTIQNSLNAGTSVTITTGSTGGEAGNITVSSAIATGTAAGTRTLTLTAAGAIVVNAAISNSTGTLDVVLNAGTTISGNASGTISGSGTTTFNAGSGSGTFSGVISKTNLIKTGAGTLVLSGVNTYTGITTINGGILSIAADTGLGAAPGVVTAGKLVLDGGTLRVTAGNVTLNANRGITLEVGGGTIDINNTVAAVTYNGIMTGVGSFTKTGSGTSGQLNLGGANTYTGTTNINSARLFTSTSNVLPDTSALVLSGTGDLYITGSDIVGSLAGNGTISNGTITAGGVADTAFSGGMSGTTGLIKTGSGTLTLSGTNTNTGVTTISAGTLLSGNAGVISDTSAVTIASGATWNLSGLNETVGSIAGAGDITLGSATLVAGGNASSTTFSGVLSGGGGFIKAGAGTLTLSGTNTYTGITTLNAGTLSIASLGNGGVAGNLGAASSSAGNLLLSGGTLQYTGATASSDRNFTLTAATTSSIDVANVANTLTLSGAAAATTGALTKLGAGTLLLSGTNAYTGVTTINAGTLSIDTLGNGGVAGNLGAANTAATNLVLGGGTLRYTGATAATDRAFTLTTGTTSSIDVFNAASTLTVSGAGASTTGALSKLGGGTLLLSGNNAYLGTTTVSAGTLTTGNNNLSSGTGVSVASGATWNLTGTDSVASIAGSGNIILGATLTLVGSPNTSFSGVLSGTGGLTKSGSGIQTLTSANTYTGATTVNGGTLAIAHLSALGGTGSGVTVSGSGTLDLQNLIYSGGDVITLSGGTLKASTGTSSYSGALAMTAVTTVDADSGAQLTLSGVISGAFNLTKATGAGTVVLAGTNTYTGITTVNGGTLSVATIGNGGVAGNLGAATTAATNLLLNAGGTLQYTGATATTNRNFTLVSASTSSISVSNAATVLTISGAAASSTGNFIKAGAGTLAFTGVNAYSGTTTISGGTLSIAADSGLGTAPGSATVGKLVLDGGTLSTAATFTLSANRGITLNAGGGSIGSTGGRLTVNSIIAGTGFLNSTGGLELGGTNTYSGGTRIASGGYIALFNDNNLGAVPGSVDASNIRLSGGSLFSEGVNVTLNANRGINIDGASGNLAGYVSDLTVNGIISGNTLTINGSGGTGRVILKGANTHAATDVQTLTLVSGAAGVLADTGAVTVASGATWNMTSFAETVGSIAGAGNIVQGTAALTAGGDNSTTTFSGIISGTGALTKTGSGTLTLSGANTKSGINTVSGTGTLLIDTTGALPGSITVDSGATLATKKDLTNTITVNGTLDLQGVAFTGANVSFGTNSTLTTSTGTSSFSDAITVPPNFTVDAGSGAQLTLSGQLSNTNALTKGTGAGTVVLGNTNNTYSGTTTINGGVLSIADTGSLGTTPGVVFNGGTFQMPGGLGFGSVPAFFTLNAGGGTIDVVSGSSSIYDRSLAGTGVFTKAGAGTLEIRPFTTTASTSWQSSAVNVTAGTLWTNGAYAARNVIILPRSLAFVIADMTVATGATLKTSYLEYVDGLSGAGNVVLGNYLVVGYSGGSSTFSGAISGPYYVYKNGTGTLTLSGGNSFSNLTINEGTVRNGAAGVVPDGAIVSLNGTSSWDLNGYNETVSEVYSNTNSTITLGAGTLTTTANTGTSFSGVISGTGGVTKTGAGTWVLTGANTYDGVTSIVGGTVALSGSGTLGSSLGGTTLNNGTTLDLRGVTLSNEALTMANNSTLATSTGTSAISSTITLPSLANNYINLNVGNGDQLTVDSLISGTSGIKNIGTGTAILTNANTYTGITTLAAGTLSVASLGNGGVASGIGAATNAATNLVFGGGTLRYSGASASTDRNFTLNAGIDSTVDVSDAGANLTWNGASTATSGGLTKAGAGTLTLGGTNLYTGGTNVNAGTLVSGKAGVINDNSAVTVLSGASWNLAGFSETVGRIAGAGDFALGNATLTTGVDNTTTTVSGVISGSGGLTKIGAGTLTLSGANTYTGATTISAGGITASNASALGSTSSGTTVASGATLSLSNALIGAESLALTGSLTNAAGTSSFAGDITLGATGAVTVNGTKLTLSGAIGDGASTFGITKTGGGILLLSGVNTYDGVTTLSAGTLALSGSGTLGSTTGNTTVASGTTLDLQGANSGTEAISIAGGTLKASGGVLGSLSTSTIGGTVTMTAASIVDAGTYDTLTVNGVISGAWGLTKTTGTGTVVLGGANTYTGATTVNGGTLGVANNNGLGTTAGGVSVASGATLDFQNVAVGAESMTALAGTLKASIGTSTYSGTIALTGNSVIDVGGSSLTLSGVISDAPTSTLTKNGAGTLILSAANTTYDGAVTVNAGTLAISNATALGSTLGNVIVNTSATLDLRGTVITNGEAVTLAGGTLAASTGASSLSLSTLTLTDNSFIDVAGTSLNTYRITGSTFSLTKSGAGLWNMTQALTGTGNLVLNEGTTKASWNSALGTTTTGTTTVNSTATLELPLAATTYIAEPIILHGGTLKSNAASGVLTFPGTISLTANSTIEATGGAQFDLSNVISGGFGFSKIGTSTLSFSGTGANTYTGVTTISQGSLIPLAADRMSVDSEVVVATGATFSTGFNQTIGSLASATDGTGTVTVSAGTLKTGRKNTNTIFNGLLSGAGALTKEGSGMMTLGGNNTYSGTTSVNAGTLAVTKDGALGTTAGSTGVNFGATLDFKGVIYSTLEPVNLNGGKLAASAGDASFAGDITLISNSIVDVTDLGSSTAIEQLTLSGVFLDGPPRGLTKTGSGTAILTNTNTYDGTTTITGGTLSIGALGNIGTGNVSLGGGTLLATNDINFASRTLTLTADSGLSAASTKTISGGVFSGAGRSLSLSGGGNFTLTNTGNDFGTVTIPSAATVSLVDANDLTLGASTVNSLTAQAGAGGTGNFTLAGQITAATSSGTPVVLATGGGSSIFTNTAGANAIALTGSARWLVYSNDPYFNADSFGGLKSYNEAVFDTTYPGAVAATGNRYVFTVGSPADSATTIAASTIDTPKVYGDALTLDKQYSLSYSTGARVFTEFSLAKPNWIDESAVTLTSAGTPVTANVGSYQITIGGLVNTDSANKTLIINNTGNVVVSARPLTLSTTAGTVLTREYDGTTNASFSVAPAFTLGNIVNSDSVSLTGTVTGSYANKNVGTGKALTWSGLSSSNANYSLPSTLPTFTGEITARTITLSATAQDKTYNQSATATVTGLSGDRKISGDDLTYSSSGALFDTANVARNGSNAVIAQNVTASGLALAGTDAANYSLTSTSASTTATINPIALALTGVTGSKEYDGSAVLSAPTFSFNNAGVLGIDQVTAVSGSATFDSRHVGTGKTLTATLGALTLTGAQGGNYSLGSGTYDGSGDITAKAVTLTLGGVTRAYDGSLSYDAISGVLTTLSGQLGVAGDTVSAASGTYDNANAGTGRTVTFNSATLNDGNSGNNYTVTLAAGSNNSAITQANLTLSTSDVTRTYDGGFTAAGTATVVAGTLYTNASNSNAQDTISGGTFAFVDKNAGSNKTVTASGATVTDGNAGGNYLVSYADNTTSTINPFAVSLTGTRVYDGTTDVAAGVLTLGALVGSETLVLTGTGSVADKHVANGKAVTLASLSLGNGSNGGAAGNYTFTGGTQTVDVTTASLTLSTGNVTKTYDGDTTAAGAAATVTSGTLFGSDAISGGSFAFDGANAGAGNKTVTVSGVTLSDGNSGSNYAVTYASNTTSTISQRAVNLTGTRSYNGTADVTSGIFTLGNVVTGEALTLTGTGTVANKNIGTGKAVTLGSLALGNGTGGLASNYTFTGGTYATDITAAGLTLSTGNVTKTYDGGTTASGSATVTSGTLFAGDAISGGSYTFTSKTASTGDKVVTVSGVTITDGNSGSNYAVTYADNTTSTINPLGITLTGFAASNKVYDRSTTATIANAGSLLGVIGGDTVSVSNSGAIFGDWNVGTGKTVTLADVSLGGADGGNYSIAATSTTTANITAKSLGLDLAGQGGKVYDGTTVISLTGVTPTLIGVIGGDTVTLNAGSVTGFADKNVGTGKAVTFSGFSLAGADLGNYALVSGSAASSADITQAGLTVTAAQVTKTYDGGTTATGAATVGALAGVGAGETVGTAATLAFTNKDAGTGNKTVSASGLVILDSGSNDVTANYNITYTDNTTSTINPYAVSFTGTRAYDGTANVGAGIFTLGALVGGETLTLGGTGTVASKNVGNGKAVTLGSLALVSGTGSASNYTFTGGTQTADVTRAGLTVTAAQVTKTYDGGTTATGAATVGALAGVGAGEVVGTAATQAFSNKDAGSGTKTVSASGLVIRDSGSADVTANYNITYTDNTTSTINPYAVSLTGTRAYDGTANVGAGIFTLGALVGGETLTLSGTGTVASKNFGNGKTVTLGSLALVNGTGLASNYTFSGGTYTADITQANLTVTAAQVTKTYDGGTTAAGAATVGALAGVGAGETVGTAATLAFNNKDAGTGNKTVTASGLVIRDSGNADVSANYNITYTDNTASTINPFAVSFSGTRVYDGTANVAAGIFTLGTLVGAETLTLSGTGTLASKNVGTAKAVTLGSIALVSGTGSVSNYSFTGGTQTADITQASLTVTAAQVIKTYDGGTTAAGAATVGALAGVGAGETVGTAATLAFTNKNVGSGNKTVTAGGLIIRDSGNADVTGNYNITYVSNTASTINTLGITLTGFSANNKVYDRNTAATIASVGSLAGVIGSDVVTVANSGATFGDWNVGSGKTVTLAGISLAGTNGGNYSIAATATTTADITARPLGLDLAGQGSKVYDGTTAITLVGVTPTLTGVIGGDTVTLNAGSVTGFVNKNAGSNKAVTFTGFGIAGADNGNYALVSGSAASSANITPRSLTVSYTGVDKVFDGSTTATTTVADDRLAGDVFAVASSANFADPLAGTNKPVAITGASLTGTDAGNYSLVATSGATTATITPLPSIPTPPAPTGGGTGTGTSGGGLPPLDGGDTGTGGTGSGGTDTTGTGGTGSGGTDTTGTGGTGSDGTDTTLPTIPTPTPPTGGSTGSGTSDGGLPPPDGGTDTTGTGGTGTGGTDTTGTGGTGTGGTDTTGTGGTGSDGTDTTLPTIPTPTPPTGGSTGSGTSDGGLPPLDGGTDTTGTGGTGAGGTDTTGTGGTGTGGTDTTGTSGTGTGGTDTTGTGGTGAGGTDTTGTGGIGSGGTDTTGTGGTGADTDPTATGGTGSDGTDTTLPTIPTPPPPTGGSTGSGTSDGGLPPPDGGTDTTGTGGTGSGGTDTTATGGKSNSGTDTTATNVTGPGDVDTTGTGVTGTGGTDTTGTDETGTRGTRSTATPGAGTKSIEITVPGGTRTELQFPAGLSVTFDAESVTISMSDLPEDSTASSDSDVSATTQLSVTMLKNGIPVAALSGLSVTEAGRKLTLSPIKSGLSAMATPGAIINRITLALQGSEGTGATFEIGRTNDGIVIRPQNQTSETALSVQQNLIIGLALAEIRKQIRTPLEGIRSIFIDQR